MTRFFRLSLVKHSAFLLGTVLLGAAAQAQSTTQQPNQPAQPGQPGAGAVDRRAAMETFMKQRIPVALIITKGVVKGLHP